MATIEKATMAENVREDRDIFAMNMLPVRAYATMVVFILRLEI